MPPRTGDRKAALQRRRVDGSGERDSQFQEEITAGQARWRCICLRDLGRVWWRVSSFSQRSSLYFEVAVEIHALSRARSWPVSLANEARVARLVATSRRRKKVAPLAKRQRKKRGRTRQALRRGARASASLRLPFFSARPRVVRFIANPHLFRLPPPFSSRRQPAMAVAHTHKVAPGVIAHPTLPAEGNGYFSNLQLGVALFAVPKLIQWTFPILNRWSKMYWIVRGLTFSLRVGQDPDSASLIILLPRLPFAFSLRRASWLVYPSGTFLHSSSSSSPPSRPSSATGPSPPTSAPVSTRRSSSLESPLSTTSSSKTRTSAASTAARRCPCRYSMMPTLPTSLTSRVRRVVPLLSPLLSAGRLDTRAGESATATGCERDARAREGRPRRPRHRLPVFCSRRWPLGPRSNHLHKLTLSRSSFRRRPGGPRVPPRLCHLQVSVWS